MGTSKRLRGERCTLPNVNARAHAEVIRTLLADVNSRATKIEAELNDLLVERRGLELSLARLTAEAAAEDDGKRDPQDVQISDPAAPPDQMPRFLSHEEEWHLLGKTAAVKRVLAEAAEPLGPSDVMAVLESVGLPQEDSEVVRGALAYLKRKGEATSVGRSQWVLIGGAVHQRLQQEGDLTSQDADAASADTEAASVPVHPIMNGGDASGTDFDRDHDDTSSGQANHRAHGHGAPVGAPN